MRAVYVVGITGIVIGVIGVICLCRLLAMMGVDDGWR
jgi:hypothetical protein